jgi:hypothetical protein
MLMSVFKKQGVYWIDYYVNGYRKRERIGPDKRLAETVLHTYKVEISGMFPYEHSPSLASNYGTLRSMLSPRIVEQKGEAVWVSGSVKKMGSGTCSSITTAAAWPSA